MMKARCLSSLLMIVTIQLAAVAPSGASTEPTTTYGELLDRGEAALARGETTQAIDAFEKAGAMAHEPAIEMGLVRAYMQAGAYRRAAAFAAHTAGAHRDEPAGAVLYAWLLHVGGQGKFAQRVLDETEKRSPGNALVADARVRLRSAAPVADGALLSAPWRVAPYDAGAALPAGARVAASAVLVDGGRRALAPIVNAQALWVRDGLGRRSAARVERVAESLGVALLTLDQPVKDSSGATFAGRDPFSGSQAFALDYAATGGASPAWPLLHAGFIGKPDGAGLRNLSIEMAAGAQGGPVLDAGARLAGIAIRAGGGNRLLPVSALRREFGDLLGSSTAEPPPVRAPVEDIYEAALPVTLQVITQP